MCVLLCCVLFDNEEDIYWECKGPLCQSYLLSFALLESVSVAHVHVRVYTCLSGQWCVLALYSQINSCIAVATCTIYSVH